MKILATAPDAELLIKNYLTTALTTRGQDVTVGMILPVGWSTTTTPPSKPHVLIALDGTPNVQYPVTAAASIRVTCFAASRTTAKALAALCEGLLLSYIGGSGIASIQSLTGILVTRDPDTNGQMATIAVRVNLRYTVLV